MRRRLSLQLKAPRVVALAVTLALALTFLPSHPSLAGIVRPLPPVLIADGRIGLCDVLPGNTADTSGIPWAQLAYNSGARINRWEFRWDRIEPDHDTWDFTQDDPAVQASQQYGLSVEGILIGTPAWAVVNGQHAGNGVPQGLNLAVGDPNNLWAQYVRETVSHYRGQIPYWEVWNEPDVKFFWPHSADTYFRLLKVAYLVIKAMDPSARVLMAGMVNPDLSFPRQVLDDAGRDPAGPTNHGFIDGVAWHAYGPARSLYDNVRNFKHLLASEGYARFPVWVTEDGFPASNPNGEPRQAAYVLQTAAYALAAGASKVLIYRASDSTEPKQWGLITSSGQPRMGYVALQVAARYFSHVQSVTYAPTPQVERFVFYEPNQRVTLLWNHDVTSHPVQLFSSQASGTEVDWLGTASTLNATGGIFQLQAPGAGYNAGVDDAGSVVGGPPRMLVEDNSRPAGLGSVTYVTPVPGAQRRVILVNNGNTEASVQLTAAAHQKERVVQRVPAHAVQMVDLDLLGGSTYAGLYVLASSAPLAAEAVSNQSIIRSSTPSTSWVLAAAPRAITVGNTASKPVSVAVTAFGPRGVVRARAAFQVAASLRATWTIPSWLQVGPIGLSVRASAPVVVASTPHLVPSGASQPQSTWYAVHPPAAQLAIFNPSPLVSASIDVQFIGGHAVRGLQLHVRARHSFAISTYGAHAVVVSATQPIAVGYTGKTASAPPLVSQPSVSAAIPAAGRNTGVAVYNPSVRPAHVALSLVGGTQSQRRTIIVPSRHVYTVRARGPGTPPRGVLVTSDVPVVSAPSS